MKHCSSCAPCTPCAPPPPEPNWRFRCSNKVRMTCNDRAVILPLGDCRCVDPKPSDLELFIRRRGTCEWALRYPAWVVENGGVTWLFDGLFAKLPLGRYEAEVRYKKEPISAVELELVSAPVVSGVGATPVPLHNATPMTTKPAGVTDMFLPFYGMEAPLTRILEKSDTTLPLSAADAARLCSAVLCQPVQLVLDDGVNRETVEFSGCVDGAPVVVRGATDCSQYRFPVGTTLRFEWTPMNVTNACQGCP